MSRYLRQLGWYDPAEHPSDAVTFVGVGGIGSFAAFGAAKLGIPNITLIDPDTVEEHNQPNQFYSQSEIGYPKVEALRSCLSGENPDIREWYGAVANSEADGLDGEYSDGLRGSVVSGLDSMDARQRVWEQEIRLKPQVPLYLDARLGGQIIVVYAVNPVSMDDIEAYEKTLHSDEEAEDAPCTERGVIDVGLMVGSVLTRHLRSHFTGGEVPKITYINQESLSITKGDWIQED